MEDNSFIFAAALYGVIAAGTQIWGLVGWLAILWIVCMLVDYGSGTLAALKARDWSSDAAREGLWHKCGMIFYVIVAVLADVIWTIVLRSGVIEMPFQRSTLVSTLVLTWFVLTELGSIAENAEKLSGKSIPWLSRFLRKAAKKAEAAGEELAGEEDGNDGE